MTAPDSPQTTTDAAQPDSEPHSVQIRPALDPHAKFDVILDGENVNTKVAALQLTIDAREPVPSLAIELHPSYASDASFDGLAHVTVVDHDVADLGTFLLSIDAEELEKAALSRHDLDPGRHGLTKAMLAQLLEWAEQ